VWPLTRSADHLDIFVTDSSGSIQTAAWEPDFADGWHGWWSINGGAAAPGAPIHGVSRSADKLDLFVIGTDDRVYTAAWEADFADGWHGWWRLLDGVAAAGAHVTAVSRSADHLDVFVIGTDNSIYTAAWEPDFADGWHGWWRLGALSGPVEWCAAWPAAIHAAMKRPLASDLLPQRAGQPVKALVHMSFADLLALDPDSALQGKWAREHRARWAARRAAASVATGDDGGAWLEGDAARKIAYDAMIIPVVTGDIDPGAVEDLITLCVEYDRLRAHVPVDAPRDTDAGENTDDTGENTDDTGTMTLPPPCRPGCSEARQAAPRQPRPLRPRSPTRWPTWNTRSWPRSSRSCPAAAAPPPSCAATCSASPSAALRSRWTSARPTTFPSTCGVSAPCGTRPASSPAAATSPRPVVRRTTSSTARMAGTPALPT